MKISNEEKIYYIKLLKIKYYLDLVTNNYETQEPFALFNPSERKMPPVGLSRATTGGLLIRCIFLTN